MKHPKNVQICLSDQCSIDFVLVEGGDFLMGDEGSEYGSEMPIHQVALDSFHMGIYQVTQAQWEGIIGSNPSGFKGANRPVEMVSWLGVQNYIKKLSVRTGQYFRLPTESEWEFAARGGIYSEGYLYAGSDKLRQVGWYSGNANSNTHEVGQLLANELGLYDMSGNVWEWCEDNWHDSYEGGPVNGTAWVDSSTSTTDRVLRGGSSLNETWACRPQTRNRLTLEGRSNNIGFRLVLPL